MVVAATGATCARRMPGARVSRARRRELVRRRRGGPCDRQQRARRPPRQPARALGRAATHAPHLLAGRALPRYLRANIATRSVRFNCFSSFMIRLQRAWSARCACSTGSRTPDWPPTRASSPRSPRTCRVQSATLNSSSNTPSSRSVARSEFQTSRALTARHFLFNVGAELSLVTLGGTGQRLKSTFSFLLLKRRRRQRAGASRRALFIDPRGGHRFLFSVRALLFVSRLSACSALIFSARITPVPQPIPLVSVSVFFFLLHHFLVCLFVAASFSSTFHFSC